MNFPFAHGCERHQATRAPEYLLALASDNPLPPMPVGLLDGGPFSWTADVKALLAHAQGQWATEIARRLGHVIQLEGASVDAVRTAFISQADRVSEVNAALAGASAALAAANSELAATRGMSEGLAGELAATRATSEGLAGELAASRALSDARAAEVSRLLGVEAALHSDIESARSRALAVEAQLAESHAKLGEKNTALAATNSELVATREIVKVHAATKAAARAQCASSRIGSRGARAAAGAGGGSAAPRLPSCRSKSASTSAAARGG